MPSAVEAERALLGALLQEPELLSRVSTDVQPDDFYRPEHAALYRLLLSMQLRQVPIDLVTVAQEILRGDGANRYGSAAYVTELPEHAVSTANAAHYAELVVETARARKLVQIGVDMVRACMEQTTPSAELARRLLTDATAVGQRARRTRHAMSVAELHPLQMEHLDDQDAGVELPPLETGLEQLDRFLGGGLRPGSQVVVAGLTGMGKTSFAMGLGVRWALESRRTLFHSGEMPKRWDLLARAQSIVTRIPITAILTGDLDEYRRHLVASWSARLDGLVLHDRPHTTYDHIATESRRMWASGGVSAIVVDYLGLLDHQRQRGETGAQAIGRTTKALKQLAIELGCVVLTLSQFNRQARKHEPPKNADPTRWWTQVGMPQVEDLRDSGEIEEDADVILFPMNAVGCRITDDWARDRAVVVVAKNRQGPTGVAQCRFDASCARYHDLEL